MSARISGRHNYFKILSRQSKVALKLISPLQSARTTPPIHTFPYSLFPRVVRKSSLAFNFMLLAIQSSISQDRPTCISIQQLQDQMHKGIIYFKISQSLQRQRINNLSSDIRTIPSTIEDKRKNMYQFLQSQFVENKSILCSIYENIFQQSLHQRMSTHISTLSQAFDNDQHEHQQSRNFESQNF